jgi:hypothetical protein
MTNCAVSQLVIVDDLFQWYEIIHRVFQTKKLVNGDNQWSKNSKGGGRIWAQSARVQRIQPVASARCMATYPEDFEKLTVAGQ